MGLSTTQILWMLVQLIARMQPPTKREAQLLAVIAYLNEQVAVMEKRLSHKPRLTWAERLQLSQLARKIPKDDLVNLVTCLWKPDTVIGWAQAWQRKMANRAQLAAKQRQENERGRPPISDECLKEILATYDLGITGLRKIVGELRKIGISVSKTTVANVLRKHGRIPGGSNDSWSSFLKRHAHLIMGVDFLSVPVGLVGKVVNIDVCFGIEHDTRKVHLLGIGESMNERIMQQMARNMTDPFDGCMCNRKRLIHDNDTKFCAAFKKVLRDDKKVPKATSILAPNMNAFAERWVRSIKDECLSKFIFLNQDMLERAVREYIVHYNNERPHQGIENNTVTPWPHAQNSGKIVTDERLGGVLKSRRRLAA